MVKLTCLLRRRDGMSPADFHSYWRESHGPLVASSESATYVLRYLQHHRPLEEYSGDDDPGYDGVTEQWFACMDDYRASVEASDFATLWADLPKFLDVDRLEFVVTEEPVVIIER